ncbi:MAG: PQQ-dependent sugar dehydrogenase [Alkalispirochaeta sp.]
MKRLSTPALFLVMGMLVFAGGSSEAQTVTDEVVERARSDAGTVALRQLVADLEHPWSVAPLPDGGALITERPGRLWMLSSLSPGSGDLQRVEGLPEIAAVGQGGLLDIVLSPTFPDDQMVFFSYSARNGGGAVTRVGRAVLDRSGGSPRLTEVEELFSLNRAVSGGQHFGSRLAFDREGYLYITIGDRGQPEQAQNAASHQGTVVRLAPDGTVPEDNPSIEGAAEGIYTWGHRNPQGMALHPRTGEMWVHEHGPRGGDEINILTAGENYGWPRVTHGVAYSGREIAEEDSLPGFVDPLLHWTPSIAPSGMAFVTGDRYSRWKDDAVVGALAGQHLRRVQLDSEGEVQDQEELFSGFARFRDVRQAPDGYLYVLTDARSGGLYRVELE